MAVDRCPSYLRPHLTFSSLPLLSCLRPYRSFRCCRPLPTGNGDFGYQRPRTTSMMLGDCEEEGMFTINNDAKPVLVLFLADLHARMPFLQPAGRPE